MKMRYLLIVVVVLFVVALASSGYAEIDQDAIVGLWLFDRDDDVARDSSKNAIAGELLGNLGSSEGKFGKALELNGSTDYISCGNTDNLKLTEEITVAAWIKTTQISRWNVVAAKEIWSSNAGWVLYISTNTVPAFSVSSTIASGSTLIETDEWYHLAGVIDSNGNIKLYVNGVQEGSGNSTLSDADIDLRIGARHPNGAGAGIVDPFPGLIDELAIFDIALEEEDIQAIMNQGLETATGILAVSSADKITTTWGSIRTQY